MKPWWWVLSGSRKHSPETTEAGFDPACWLTSPQAIGSQVWAGEIWASWAREKESHYSPYPHLCQSRETRSHRAMHRPGGAWHKTSPKSFIMGNKPARPLPWMEALPLLRAHTHPPFALSPDEGAHGTSSLTKAAGNKRGQFLCS